MLIRSLPFAGGTQRVSALGTTSTTRWSRAADRVAVALDGLRPVAVDLDPAGLEQLQLRVLAAAAEQDPGGQGQPVEQGAGLEHGHVQQAVVGPGVGHDRQPALEPAQVADQDPLAGPVDRRPVVEAQPEPGRRAAAGA